MVLASPIALEALSRTALASCAEAALAAKASAASVKTNLWNLCTFTVPPLSRISTWLPVHPDSNTSTRSMCREGSQTISGPRAARQPDGKPEKPDYRLQIANYG